ncbi:metalloregulator ArsR/SmtB family transcription factor [Halobacillus litoralis]|uniref:Metalloregulator ArsR/SmtB family transcription factor n=1 Tax=Halobacillus litoralis TaxID=45668 RepID=A0A845FFH6_9BACI|nr:MULTISPECIES: metalloregulator ArsR/SmtB family transcription factor [Halobacillus]MEC3883653.1 metalloregulator ArsR/SmtB family transcription factor [Halobacillus sp. HZG1]MYL72528.1 metalloregulator ArsR/SmtB family transcription factor [Halobacillus litoralis]
MKETMIELEQAAHTLKLLGDKTRLTILGLVKDSECCVCEFVEVLQMSQPSISQHLRKLRDAGLVKEQRRGQWIFYSLNREHATYPIIQQVLEQIPDQKEKLTALEEAGLRIQCDS